MHPWLEESCSVAQSLQGEVPLTVGSRLSVTRWLKCLRPGGCGKGKGVAGGVGLLALLSKSFRLSNDEISCDV